MEDGIGDITSRAEARVSYDLECSQLDRDEAKEVFGQVCTGLRR